MTYYDTVVNKILMSTNLSRNLQEIEYDQLIRRLETISKMVYEANNALSDCQLRSTQVICSIVYTYLKELDISILDKEK